MTSFEDAIPAVLSLTAISKALSPDTYTSSKSASFKFSKLTSQIQDTSLPSA